MLEIKNKELIKKNIIIVSGMSGAGKTGCIQVLLDFDYLIISSLGEKNFYEVISTILDKSPNTKIAIILNIINKEDFDSRYIQLQELHRNYQNIGFKQIFIKANEQTLINRYQENRKLHPYAVHNDMRLSLKKCIFYETNISQKFVQDSDFVIDTSTLTVRESQEIITNYLNEKKEFTINISSFGFKYRTPDNLDFMFDLRFLPNPFYELELRPKTGQDKEVFDYVFSFPEAEKIYQSIYDIITTAIPGFQNIGKVLINIGFGCTGGQHRSVAFSERLKKDLAKKYNVHITHFEEEDGHWND